MRETVRLLEGLGHELVEASPTVDRQAFSIAYLTVIAAETRDAHRAGREAGGPQDVAAPTSRSGRGRWPCSGQAFSAGQYAGALNYLQASRGIARFFEALRRPAHADPRPAPGAHRLAPAHGAERRQVEIMSRLNAGWLMKALGVIKPLADKTFEFMPYTPSST